LAGCSCSVVFLFFETLSGAGACNMVSLELFEEFEDFIIGQESCSRVDELAK